MHRNVAVVESSTSFPLLRCEGGSCVNCLVCRSAVGFEVVRMEKEMIGEERVKKINSWRS
jgi:hypothetical protein